MPDWVQYVRQRLPLDDLKLRRETEIVEDIARQLEDFYREARAQGFSETEAETYASEQIRDWESFASDLVRVARQSARPKIELWHDNAVRNARRTNGGWTMFADLSRDLIYGVRMLFRSPGITTAAVVILALGLGVNAAMFELLDTVFLTPLPYPEPNRLIQVWEANQKRGWSDVSVDYMNFQDWREQNEVFDSMALYDSRGYNLSGEGDPERIAGVAASANFFAVLGRKPALGREFRAEDDRPGADAVVILSHGVWERRFGADPEILGETLLLNSEPHTVIGVMPSDFASPGSSPDLWTTLRIDPATVTRGGRQFGAMARLRSGVTLAQARTNLNTITARLEQEYPDTNAGWGVTLITRHEELFDQDDNLTAIVAYLAVIFVLLVACANVANLLLARAGGREKEIAVRMALGAGRFRLVRQLLAESVLLGLLGGAGAVVVAFWGLEGMISILPPDIPNLSKVALDGTLLLYILGLSLLTGIIFGLAPAWQSTRPDIQATLKEGGRTSSGASRHRLLKGLVVGEVALTFVLLVGSGLMVRSYQEILTVNPGFDTSNLLTLRTSLPPAKYEENPQRVEFYDRVIGRIAAISGVEHAAAVHTLPLAGSNSWSPITIEGRTVEPDERITVGYQVTTPDYFRAMGIELRQGRFFSEQDTADSMPVVIVNETMTRTHWPEEESLLGRRFKRGAEDSERPWMNIVGVVADVKHQNLGSSPRPEMYMPYTQVPLLNMTLVARTSTDPLTAASAAREAVWAADPDQAVFDLRSMEQVLRDRNEGELAQAQIFGVLGFISLVLAALGVYAVVAYSVSERTHEIGVRMALGASPGRVFSLVLRQGFALVAIGVVIGLAGAFGLTRFMESLLFGVTASDPATYGGITLLFVAVALLATYLPARRATRVDPMVALRYE